MTTRQETHLNLSPYASRPWLKHYDYWVPAEINFPRQPIYQILQLAAGRFGESPATAFFGAHLTYRELKGQVDRLATALARLGIAKGDRVGIMLPNSPQYLISFFAIVRLGAIVTNINPIYTLREVDLVTQDAGS
jgi:long-chain acyl-CoA synthetase